MRAHVRHEQREAFYQERRLIRLGNVAREARTNWDRPDIMSKPKMTWSPHLATLLAGVNDDSSPLGLLKGQESSPSGTFMPTPFILCLKTGG